MGARRATAGASDTEDVLCLYFRHPYFATTVAKAMVVKKASLFRLRGRD
jgi:hypothetical protein